MERKSIDPQPRADALGNRMSVALSGLKKKGMVEIWASQGLTPLAVNRWRPFRASEVEIIGVLCSLIKKPQAKDLRLSSHIFLLIVHRPSFIVAKSEERTLKTCAYHRPTP